MQSLRWVQAMEAVWAEARHRLRLNEEQPL